MSISYQKTHDSLISVSLHVLMYGSQVFQYVNLALLLQSYFFLPQLAILSQNHLLTNQYCRLNSSPNTLILFIEISFHVLDPVSEFIMNLT
jgi:hypothetical protein